MRYLVFNNLLGVTYREQRAFKFPLHYVRLIDRLLYTWVSFFDSWADYNFDFSFLVYALTIFRGEAVVS